MFQVYFKMNCLFIFVVVCSLLGLSYQRSVALDDHYVAAVVEIAPEASEEMCETYIGFIEEAAALGVDIIIFPENYPFSSEVMRIPMNGLLKTYPVPALSSDVYDSRLVRMSEAARNNSMYVVVNFQEFLDCTRNDSDEFCPETKQYMFNTNVVLDRRGAVIHRYRKNHLYGESGVTPALERGIGTFDTDFGVTFGILICFDLLNQVPLQAVVRNVTNLLVNVNWIAEMPFLTAIQAHEAIAYAIDVNLMVAGANNVSDGASGSGIYSGKSGALTSIMTGVPTSQLLVAKVPKIPGNVRKNPGHIKQNPKDLDGLKILVDRSIPLHITRPVLPGYQEFTLVYKDITCKFRIYMKENHVQKKYKYRAGAFSGIRLMSEETNVVRTRDCAVFSCIGDSIDTCGQKFSHTEDATAEFDELYIEGTIPTTQDPRALSRNSTFYPVSLDVSLLPLDPEDFEYSVVVHNDVTVHKLNLTNHEAQLYTFALWGRQFD